MIAPISVYVKGKMLILANYFLGWIAKDIQAQRMRAPPRMRGTRGSRSMEAMKRTSSSTGTTSTTI